MSNPLRKMFETDASVEREGIWVEYAPGVEIRIARAGGSNKRFAKTMQRLAKPHRRAIQTESVDEDVLKELVSVSWQVLSKKKKFGQGS